MKLEKWIGNWKNYTSKTERPGNEDGWEEKDGKDSSFFLWLLVNAEISIINQYKI